jgi:hypothetical protein
MAKAWFTHSRHESRKIDGLAGSIYEIAISPFRQQLLNFSCLAFPSQIFFTGTLLQMVSILIYMRNFDAIKGDLQFYLRFLTAS